MSERRKNPEERGEGPRRLGHRLPSADPTPGLRPSVDNDGACGSANAEGDEAAPELVVACERDSARARAEELAGRLGVELCSAAELEASQLALRVDDDGLTLVRDGMELRGDFARMLPRLRQGALQRELLVKAARVKDVERPVAVDATAGLGEDSLLLAAAGFEVTLCECDAVIAALLEDALRRAGEDPRLADAVGRMHVVQGDSVELLRGLPVPPDVVYLDPMFPGRTKSAAVKKKFQLIHHLEHPASSEDERRLLDAALAAHPRKIVVKRPIKAPCLAGVKPSHVISGKAVRYDCIVPPHRE